MYRRMITLAAGAALAVAAVAASAGGAVAADHHANVAHGRTGQGRNIRIKVMPGKVQLRSFSIELHCSGGYLLVDQESGFEPTKVNAKGQMHDHQYGSTDEVLLRGKLHGRVIRGQIRVRDRLGKHHCSSPWIRFHAKAKR